MAEEATVERRRVKTPGSGRHTRSTRVVRLVRVALVWEALWGASEGLA